MVAVGGTLFFTASDDTHGRELWKSDGTAAGTVQVKNINPNDSARRSGSYPRNLTVVDGVLFFSASDGAHGRELWKSDGTAAGTVQVKNIDPDDSARRSGSYPRNLTVVDGVLFFSASDGAHGRELWKSDGTKVGTVLVRNINRRREGYASSGPASLTTMGGRLFFSARDGIHERELWKSDGSRAGTVLVKNIAPQGSEYYSSGDPADLTVMSRRLFFSAEDGTHGTELWKSDGSRAGTVLVKDIDPIDAAAHYPGSHPSRLTAMKGRLFFVANDGTHGRELWKSDGTRAGTVLVKDVKPGASYDGGPASMTAMGGRLFFAARDGIHGKELWTSDGTRAGTILVKNINLNRSGTASSVPSALTAIGSRLFFAADDGVHGEELWTSDGTTSGTVLVKDIDPCGDAYDAPSSLTAVDGRLFFAADDGMHGKELWTSDGTTEGTVLVKDIKTATS